MYQNLKLTTLGVWSWEINYQNLKIMSTHTLNIQRRS